MSKNATWISINKVLGFLGAAIGGTGTSFTVDAVANGSTDTGTLIASALTSLTTIIYGAVQFFKGGK